MVGDATSFCGLSAAVKYLNAPAKLGSRGKFDRVILLAGDGDFEDVIDYVKSELDKEVWIAGYPSSVSTDLHVIAAHQ